MRIVCRDFSSFFIRFSIFFIKKNLEGNMEGLQDTRPWGHSLNFCASDIKVLMTIINIFRMFQSNIQKSINRKMFVKACYK